MSIGKFQSAVLALLLALSAGAAHAAFNVSVPIQIPNANTFVSFAFEVNFAASTGPENFTLTINSSTNAGAVGYFTDIDRCSVATGVLPWTQGELLVGSLNFGAGSQQTPYTTPNYAGRVVRFSITLIPTNAAGVFPCDWTVALSNGAQPATAAAIANPPPAFSQAAAIGTSGASSGIMLTGTNKLEGLYYCSHGGAQDRIEYELSINFGTTPTTTPRNIGIAAEVGTHAAFPPQGTGALRFDLYDLSVDGYAQPSLSFVVSTTTAFDAKTHQVPAGLSGIHVFRVVVSAESAMTPTLVYLLAMAIDSRCDLAPLTWTPANARQNINIQSTGTAAFLTPDITGLGWMSAETLTVAGGSTTTPNYTWSVVSPSWLGVTNTSGNNTQLTVVGPLPPNGQVQVTVRVENDFSVNNNSIEFVERQFTVTVGVSPASLDILTTSLPGGVETVFYGPVQIDAFATGGLTAPFVWSTSGSVPPGLIVDVGSTTLSTSISGTPTAAGNYNFSVTITKGTVTDTQAFNVAIGPAPTLNITTTSLPNGQAGILYAPVDIVAVATGGLMPPFTWNVAGSLPPGLMVNLTATGLITSFGGMPTAAGTYMFDVIILQGSISDLQSFSVTIDPPPPPPLTIQTSSLPSGTANAPYTANIGATGGNGTYTWQVAAGSNLPNGLSLSNTNAATVTLSGAVATAAVYSFTLEVTDGTSSDSQLLSLTINNAPPPTAPGSGGAGGGGGGCAVQAGGSALALIGMMAAGLLRRRRRG